MDYFGEYDPFGRINCRKKRNTKGFGGILSNDPYDTIAGLAHFRSLYMLFKNMKSNCKEVTYS